MRDPLIDAIVRRIEAEAAALAIYRRAAQTLEVERNWYERNGWDDQSEMADRILGHLRGEIRELDTAQ